MRTAGWLPVVAACSITFGLGTVARADGAPPDDSLQVHAFASEGGLLTTTNNYLAFDENGSLEFAEAGINFRKQLTDNLSAGVQLFGRDLGGTDLNAQLDWFGLDYRWRDWLGIRVGRVKIPFGLYNDSQDIDAVLPVVLLPQGIYPLADRQFLLAQTGVDIYGFRRLGDRGGALQYEAYLGALALTLNSATGVVFNDVHVPYVAGGRLVYETPIDGLRVAASILAGKIDGDVTLLVPMPPPEMPLTIQATQLVGSVEYVGHGVQLAAEYQRVYGSSVFGTKMSETTEAMYGLAGYHWTSWFQTTGYLSASFPNVVDRNPNANHQYDAALCLRFDINAHWLVKLEAHFMKGTAVLDPTINNNVPQSQLPDTWGLFTAKTTVYF
jgi:hypothetical protein